MRRRDDAAAEAAISGLVGGCTHFANATICPRDAALCATGELCVTGSDSAVTGPLKFRFEV
jgi:hypothetical protein